MLLSTVRVISGVVCISVGMSSVVHLSTTGSCIELLVGLGANKVITCIRN